ncbi:MAG: terpene cyclase/mutase family protein [Gemmataceae bacterium]|nr:terpene cyclase/mutase family protein [Gemmataceae bacterium]
MANRPSSFKNRLSGARPDPNIRKPAQTHQGRARRPATQPEMPEVSIEAPPRKRRFLLFFLCLLLLAGVGSAVAVVAISRGKVSPRQKDMDAALARLRELQREWWENEGLGRKDNSDLAASFARLQEREREWWDSENLIKEGDADGNEAMQRLEAMQRNWWERNGMAKGEKPSDSAAALAQLDEINRQWWRNEGVRKAATNDETGNAQAPEGSDRDYRLSREKENEKKFLEGGGTEASERAVQLGLAWLAANQEPDGRWRGNGKVAAPPRGKGNDVSATAFALLPFLAHGITQRAVEGNDAGYTKRVETGLKFLVKQQKADGDLRGGGDMYTHALATIVLCEAADASSDPLLREPAQKAIDFLIKAQHKGGGWRYGPGQAGDLSVTSWCLMALKSGQMAGLHIPMATIDGGKQFLGRMSRPDGGYNYVVGSGGHSPPQPCVMTAAGIVCRQYLHQDRKVDSPEMTRGVDLILAHPPSDKIHNYYYYYYATYALLPVGGEAWKTWNPQVRDLMVSLQDQGDRNPAFKGSWDPQRSYQLTQAGRVGVTSLALLTLEVYYRHLPLNRPELGEIAKPKAR